MPVAPPKTCTVPGCANLTAAGRCDMHRREALRQADRYRGTTTQRGYDQRWENLRRAKLSTDPVCQIRTHCQGAVADEVDHIVPIRMAPELRLDWPNLQSACRACHHAKTARENPLGG